MQEVCLPSQAREAVCFAVLGAATLDGEPSNVPTATGAARRVVLGSVTPRPTSAGSADPEFQQQADQGDRGKDGDDQAVAPVAAQDAQQAARRVRAWLGATAPRRRGRPARRRAARRPVADAPASSRSSPGPARPRPTTPAPAAGRGSATKVCDAAAEAGRSRAGRASVRSLRSWRRSVFLVLRVDGVADARLVARHRRRLLRIVIGKRELLLGLGLQSPLAFEAVADEVDAAVSQNVFHVADEVVAGADAEVRGRSAA